MIPIPINLAVEDLLSEVVARRLLATSGKNYAIGAVYGREGNGYLKKTSRGWNNAAQGVPFFLLTDLDDVVCPAALKASWLAQPVHRNLIFVLPFGRSSHGFWPIKSISPSFLV